MTNTLQAVSHSGANIWLVIGLTIIIAFPFLGCNIAMPIVLRKMKTHEFKASDRSKNEKFFTLKEHKIWSALFLITIIFEFALGICGIAFIALSVKAGQSSSLSVHDSTQLIVGICMLVLVGLSIVNLLIITTKRHILLDKLRK